MKSILTISVACVCVLCSPVRTYAASTAEVLPLWPGLAPGEKEGANEERDTTGPKDGLVAGKPVIRLGNVTKPTLTIYRPQGLKQNGTAVIVCPGGGYHILAMDL